MRLSRFALCTMLLMSCVGTEIGNPPTPAEAEVSVDMQAVDEPMQATPIGLTLSDDLEIDRAVILVGALRFRPSSTCSESDASSTDGFVAELLEAGNELDDVILPSGFYCRLDIQLRRGGDDGFADEPELDELTAYAEGSYQGTPLVVRYRDDDDVSLRDDFELPPGEQLLSIDVDLTTWFEGIDLDAAVVDAEGRIVIGRDGSFETELEENFARSISATVGEQVLQGQR